MQKSRLLRAPLLALFALLAVLIVPAAAQAHHIELVASCDESSNVSWRVDFVGFSAGAQPTTTGTVKVDGVVAQNVPGNAAIDFSTSPGTLSGSIAGAGGRSHVVLAEFSWRGGSDTAEVTTNVCPAAPPANPPGNPPGSPPGTPPGTPPAGGGVLPDTIVSGIARLRGPSGCVKRAFRARVTGRSIASVAFYVDGKLVKRFNSERARYSIKVRPSGYGFGRHRVVARVTFVTGSGTPARRLPLTFRRCAQGAVAPRFTG
jgi:hypothetical protein